MFWVWVSVSLCSYMHMYVSRFFTWFLWVWVCLHMYWVCVLSACMSHCVGECHLCMGFLWGWVSVTLVWGFSGCGWVSCMGVFWVWVSLRYGGFLGVGVCLHLCVRYGVSLVVGVCICLWLRYGVSLGVGVCLHTCLIVCVDVCHLGMGFSGCWCVCPCGCNVYIYSRTHASVWVCVRAHFKRISKAEGNCHILKKEGTILFVLFCFWQLSGSCYCEGLLGWQNRCNLTWWILSDLSWKPFRSSLKTLLIWETFHSVQFPWAVCGCACVCTFGGT